MAGIDVTDALRRIGDAVSTAVDSVVENRWEAARSRAAATGGDHRSRVATLVESTRQELVVVGAAAGGTAALPGVGTIASLSTTAAEMAWFTGRSGELIMAIAAVHGHTDAELEERKAWILAVLAYGDDAAEQLDAAWWDVAKGLRGRNAGGVRMRALGMVNDLLARRLIARYGSRRSAVALGRALPFGFGAVVGGAANRVAVDRIGRAADSLFRDLPQALR